MDDEEMDKIRRLQNGSDVRGVALEGEKGRAVDLTPRQWRLLPRALASG